MRSPRDMHIICIDVTNRCDLRCSNCTRLLVNQDHHWDMTPDNFRLALRSLQGFSGVIAMIGGNPCVHKNFPDLCRVFAEEIPVKRQRGLWSNNVFNYQELIRDTFGFFNLNPHNDERCVESLTKLRDIIPGLAFYTGNSRHSPLMTAVRDIYHDEAEMWQAISQCDINKNWSATIIQNRGELRAYFCEVAASFDLARGGDHGVPVTDGWWRQSIVDFSSQVKRFCPGCGVPARLKGHLDSDETDDYTVSNADIACATRGKRKTVLVEVAAPEREARPVTDYSELHKSGAAAVDTGTKVSVVIPCYNAAATIEEAINSVLAQRVPGKVALEIIVADDASTDDSRKRVEQLAERLPGVIRLLPATAAASSGAAAARNRGLKVATGELVCFLDADDWYGAGFFEAAVELFAADSRAAAVVTGFELVGMHREIHRLQLDALVHSLPSNMILRRPIAELLGGFPEHAAFRGAAAGEDVAFKRALYNNFQVRFMDPPFLKYRVQRGSHFDRFLDRTKIVGDKMVFTGQPSPEERDGSLQAALQAYYSALEARLSIAQQCHRDRPLSIQGWDPLIQYEQVRKAMGTADPIDPREGYVLYRCAALGPLDGAIGASRRSHESIWKWLDEGARSAGRAPVEALEDAKGNGQAAALRLLVIDISDGSPRWIGDLNAGVGRLASGAYLIVHGVPEGANADDVHRALSATKQKWRMLVRFGRLMAFEKQS